MWKHKGPGWWDPSDPEFRSSRMQRRWRGRRYGGRFLFLRFFAVFGLITLLTVGGIGAVAFLFTRLFGGGGQIALLVWVSGCGLAVALPVLAATIAMRAFRSIASPLASVMGAAEAVAEGDLNVRVPERERGEFGGLARAFNRMVEELQRADEQRRNLTADVAHELRTPLHVIQGNLEGILDGVYEPTEATLNALLDETQTLARLVEDLQTLSLAEAGELHLIIESMDVAALLEDVATSFSGQAEAAGITLNTDAQDGMTIQGDAGRLDQVLSNLVINALRHTTAGGEISLSAEPMEAGVRILVSDTGSGIPPEDLPYVFDRFWRGDKARSHADGGGHGLGLAIANQLVRSHGGVIRVESEVGKGTKFTVELPKAQRRTETADRG